MLCEAVLAMEAIDPALNRYRVWRIEAGRDLLGDLVVVVKFGRKGARGRTIIKATADEAAARRLWRRSVARRAGAKRRCGVAYRVVGSAGLDGWSGEVGLAGLVAG
jgi:predicted DNA-binding WGR domain protein